VTEQKDVPEFLAKLFADMETQAQGTPSAALVKEVFGAVQLQELIADDPRPQAPVVAADVGSAAPAPPPRLYSAKADEQLFLQLVVKDKPRLEDALAAYVAGETVEYKWDLPPLPAAVGGAATDPAASAAGGAAASS
jgi:hypothetical protein